MGGRKRASIETIADFKISFLATTETRRGNFKILHFFSANGNRYYCK